MAEQPKILVDPISSDGSEESWILLDEMNEAMNDIDEIGGEVISDIDSEPIQSLEIAETASARVTEALETPVAEINRVQECERWPSEDDDSDLEDFRNYGYNKYVNERSSFEKKENVEEPESIITLYPKTAEYKAYKEWLKANPIDPLDMVVNCKPIGMTMKDGYVTPVSIEELEWQERSIIEKLIKTLEKLNNFFANTYLGQVFLLIVTIISLTSFSILYYRYTNIKSFAQNMETRWETCYKESIRLEADLIQCRFVYDKELKKNKQEAAFCVDSDPIVRNDFQTKTIDNSINDEKHNIHPTKSNENVGAMRTETTPSIDDNYKIPVTLDKHGRIMWLGDDDPELEAKLPADVWDEYILSQFSSRPNERKVHSTNAAKMRTDIKPACRLPQLDLSKGIKKAYKILSEANCDEGATITHILDAIERQYILNKEKNRQKQEKHEKKDTKREKFDKNNYEHNGHYDSRKNAPKHKDYYDEKYRKDHDKSIENHKNRKDPSNYKDNKRTVDHEKIKDRSHEVYKYSLDGKTVI